MSEILNKIHDEEDTKDIFSKIQISDEKFEVKDALSREAVDTLNSDKTVEGSVLNSVKTTSKTADFEFLSDSISLNDANTIEKALSFLKQKADYDQFNRERRVNSYPNEFGAFYVVDENTTIGNGTVDGVVIRMGVTNGILNLYMDTNNTLWYSLEITPGNRTWTNLVNPSYLADYAYSKGDTDRIFATNNYVNGAFKNNVNGYTDTVGSNTYNSSKNYTDTRLANLGISNDVTNSITEYSGNNIEEINTTGILHKGNEFVIALRSQDGKVAKLKINSETGTLYVSSSDGWKELVDFRDSSSSSVDGLMSSSDKSKLDRITII